MLPKFFFPKCPNLVFFLVKVCPGDSFPPQAIYTGFPPRKKKHCQRFFCRIYSFTQYNGRSYTLSDFPHPTTKTGSSTSEPRPSHFFSASNCLVELTHYSPKRRDSNYVALRWCPPKLLHLQWVSCTKICLLFLYQTNCLICLQFQKKSRTFASLLFSPFVLHGWGIIGRLSPFYPTATLFGTTHRGDPPVFKNRIFSITFSVIKFQGVLVCLLCLLFQLY